MLLQKVRIVIMVGCILGGAILPISGVSAQEESPATLLKAEWVTSGNALRELPHQPAAMADKPAASTASGQPDVLPNSVFDWSRLAFDSGRDGNWEIYTARGDGVQPFRVTNHPGSDVQPQLNQGATVVVFASNRNGGQFDIYSVDADGSNVLRITTSDHDDSYPTISPDGAQIAFARYQENNWELYGVRADGSGQTRLTSDSNFDDLMPSWSPDGQRIAWVRSQNGMGAIWTMNSDGSGMQALTLPYRYLQNPRWSPDGRRIAFDADLDGDYWNELAIFDPNLGYIVATHDPQQPLLDVWASAWSPDGQYVSFSQVRYVVVGSQLYIGASVMGHMRINGGMVTLLPGSGLDILNDWRTADIDPPVSQVAPLPAYSRAAGFAVTWTGADAGLAGLAGFDVQVRIGASGNWTNWLQDTSQTTATYTGAPNTFVAFRVRARDQAGNIEAWPTTTNGDAATTLYSWQLTGLVLDSRGVPLPGASVSISPVPVAPARSDARGNYATLLLANGAHTLSASLTGYGAAPASAFDMVADRFVAISLPPADDRVQNGGFDASGQPLGGWQSSGSARTTQPGQWGARAAALGEVCPAPCLSQATPLWPGNELDYPDIAVDSAGDFHAVFGGWDGLLSQPVALHGVRLSNGEVISPTLVGGAGDYHYPTMPRLAIAADDTLHAVWVGEQGLYYSSRPPGGSWMPALVIGPGEDPDIAVDSRGHVHIIYLCFAYECASSSRIFYRERLATGTWQAPQAQDSGDGYTLPGITVGPDDAIHLIWQESGRGSINVRTRWADGSWSARQTIFTDSGYSYQRQVILADPFGGIHALWNWPYQVYYAYRQPNGTWSTPLALPQMQRSFRAAVDPHGRIHVLGMLEYMPDSGLYYAVRQPNGAWSAPSRIADGIHEIAFGADGVPQLLTHHPNGLGPMLYRTAARLAQPTASSLAQTVTIPSQMHRPTLSFWYRIDGAVPNSQTRFVVTLTADATTTEIYSATVAPDWQQQAVDLSPWRGQTVTVGLELRQAAGDFYETLLLDTVTLGSWLTPTPASIQPEALPAFTTARLTIRGDNFLPGASVRVGATPLNGVVWVDAQTLQVDLPSSFGAGMYDLWVINPGGQASVLPAGLRLGRFVWLPR